MKARWLPVRALALPVALLVALPGCKKAAAPAASCAERVALLSTRLKAPRPIDEIRKGASPALAADLDAAAAADSEANRAVAYAERLEKATVGCAELVRVFGDMAAPAGPVAKADLLRTRVPPAIEACRCVASPEHAGGLIEAILSSWDER